MAAISAGRSTRRLSNDCAPILDRRSYNTNASPAAKILPTYSCTSPIRQLLSSLIAYQIFRHLELPTVQHPATFEVKDQASFSAWIRRESFIRLMTMALMLDTNFGIFHNTSPRFQWAELDVPFHSPDTFFCLANYDALLASNLQITPTTKLKIKDAFLLLFSPPETAEENLRVLRAAALTALDMQMLIHCSLSPPPFSSISSAS